MLMETIVANVSYKIFVASFFFYVRLIWISQLVHRFRLYNRDLQHLSTVLETSDLFTDLQKPEKKYKGSDPTRY